MKPLKYTVAALAILAAASFTQSAHAAAIPAGNLFLGIEDTTNAVSNSYELNLGSFSSLTNNETWNLGGTTSALFGSSSTLQFNIAATGGVSGAGGLGANQLAFTAVSLPSPNGAGGTTYTTATLGQKIAGVDGQFASGTTVTLPSNTSSNGSSISAVTVSNSTSGSFYDEFDPNGGSTNGNGQYGFVDGQLGDSFPTGDVLTLYTLTNGGSSPVAVGTFSLSNVGGNEILTFDTIAVPEPSTYALGLCAVALFFVLRRRSSVA